ncbi:hypothetical protein G5V59_20940 [Nocardioides sp. W3-2-3]|uniref:hypothetical protein n=1 Tax=Nocardioides convexus TaxID=2712224 RepID=UPI00241817B8|nr:hypothetical protein [Nocardioides convexus]NHA01450.1 hypothetical protein [Nocardioides convexus]
MSEQQARPVQATLAGGLIIGGSLLLIALAWERVSLLNTLDVREGLQEWLTRNEVRGLTVEEITATIRVLCIVGGGAAAASAILGFQVFQRSTSARLVLAGLAPLLLVGGLATSTPLGILAVLGVALLWAQPTRDWYAGRPWAEQHRERREQRLALMRSGSPTLPPASPASPAPQQGQAPVPPPPGAPALPRERPLAVRRPGALTGGCILTWVLTPLVALSGLLGVVRAVGDSGQALRRRQGAAAGHGRVLGDDRGRRGRDVLGDRGRADPVVRGCGGARRPRLRRPGLGADRARDLRGRRGRAGPAGGAESTRRCWWSC